MKCTPPLLILPLLCIGSLFALAHPSPPATGSTVSQRPPGATVAATPAPQNEAFRESDSKLVLRVDYEDGTLTGTDQSLVAEGPSAQDALSISDQQPRNGKLCLRTKVAHSDDYVSHGAHRAETATSRLAPSGHNEGDVFRYRFSFRLQEDWQFDTRDSMDIIWQFKRLDGTPDLFVGVKGQDIVLRCGLEGQWTLAENWKAGDWMDLCLIVRWSTGPNGLVEAFSKRATRAQFKRAASFRGPNMRDTRADSTYLKWGIYKPAMKASTARKPRVIYHDDIIVEKMASAATR